MDKSVHIVFTTINEPKILENLYANISQYGHLDEVKVWVIGDRKTPATAWRLAREVSQKGLETEFVDIEEQDRWGSRFPLYECIPYNTDGRRILGYLRALDEGCSVLVSIDDDNFPTNDDLIGFHKSTGSNWEGSLLSEPGGFHNICEHLRIDLGRVVYPRGFPFNLRDKTNRALEVPGNRNVRIGVREGLWVGDPDVDATTWLNGKLNGSEYFGPDTFVLHQSTWCPINTQNTSVIRQLIPAFIFVIMGFNVPGGKIDRYGDIWGGYFLLALMRGTEYHTAFGRPIVDHRRNPHNYVDDLRHEFWGIVLTDWLLNALQSEFSPVSNQVVPRVYELAEFIEVRAENSLPTWCPNEVQEFLRYTSKRIKLWASACEQIGV